VLGDDVTQEHTSRYAKDTFLEIELNVIGSQTIECGLEILYEISYFL